MLFIPKALHAGFQERADTYTGRLAYIIYTDDKNKKRKEYSWSGWKNDSTPVRDMDNVPTEGFALNKKAGGKSWGWNDRRTVCRVYDPRGFEFEISIDNLLYILENTNSIKGKGLVGEFVYAWEGADLILMPVGTKEYKQAKKYSDDLFSGKKIGAKDLKVGYNYDSKTSKGLVYLGKFNKEFLFAVEANQDSYQYLYKKDKFEYFCYKSVSNKFIKESDEPTANVRLATIEYKIMHGFIPKEDIVTQYEPITEKDILRSVNKPLYFVHKGTIIPKNNWCYQSTLGEIHLRDPKWVDYHKRIPMKKFLDEYKPQKVIIHYLGEEIKRIGY